MREIKFRAWDSRQKQMCYDVNLYSDSDGTWWDAYWFGEDQQKMSCFDANQDGSELMQYTGLKDKNGQEIFEGDIVKTSECLHEDEGIYHIEYGSYGCAGFGLHLDGDWGYWLDAGEVKSLNIEVIGNIHENPELLNK